MQWREGQEGRKDGLLLDSVFHLCFLGFYISFHSVNVALIIGGKT